MFCTRLWGDNGYLEKMVLADVGSFIYKQRLTEDENKDKDMVRDTGRRAKETKG